MTADQSILDAIAYARTISVSVGKGLITENISTDLDGMKTFSTYIANIAKSFGETPIDNSSIVDNLTAMSVITQNLGKIVKNVS